MTLSILNLGISKKQEFPPDNLSSKHPGPSEDPVATGDLKP